MCALEWSQPLESVELLSPLMIWKPSLKNSPAIDANMKKETSAQTNLSRRPFSLDRPHAAQCSKCDFIQFEARVAAYLWAHCQTVISNLLKPALASFRANSLFRPSTGASTGHTDTMRTSQYSTDNLADHEFVETVGEEEVANNFSTANAEENINLSNRGKSVLC